MANIVVRIIGDSSSLTNATGKAEIGLAGLAKSAAKMALGFAGVMGVEGALKGSIDRMEQLESASVKITAALKSTHDASGMTATSIKQLTAALSEKDRVDKLSVSSAENFLLRYTNIRNVVGQGNDVFNRATQASLDFAAATGRSASSAAQMLGKALQDPTSGMNALRRAGVVLTQTQKDSIKTMQAQGNMLGAQKLLLGLV